MQSKDLIDSLLEEAYNSGNWGGNIPDSGNVLAEIEAAAVERFVKERFWNSKCEVSACVAESGMRWAENRRKEAQG